MIGSTERASACGDCFLIKRPLEKMMIFIVSVFNFLFFLAKAFSVKYVPPSIFDLSLLSLNSLYANFYTFFFKIILKYKIYFLFDPNGILSYKKYTGLPIARDCLSAAYPFPVKYSSIFWEWRQTAWVTFRCAFNFPFF